MNALFAELQRLYFLPAQHWHGRDGDDPVDAPRGRLGADTVARGLTGEATIALELIGSDGEVRTLVADFRKARDWERVAGLYQALHDALHLPAPAISVTGQDGYRLWISLAEAVPVSEARRFLSALRARYLADLPSERLALFPGSGAPAPLAPGVNPATGKWAVFIDPHMGGMFIDEPWLEMAPGLDRQAELLASFKSVEAADFQRVLERLEASADTDAAALPAAHPGAHKDGARERPCDERGLNVEGAYRDPHSFLLAVMNDSSARPRHRIEAARALLPYFARPPAE